MKGHSPVVAVVDDDADVLRALQRLLRSEGFNVLVYGSGGEFLESFGEATPDCLVLDLHMPEMTGFDVLEALHTLPKGNVRPPVIVLTGHDTPVDAPVRSPAAPTPTCANPPTPTF
ncbi:response regulator transcription factor [Arenimonas daejeonensis]|uniref:response regulator transcription factor n=1 Tax=Arenimonas daejeonensis TaxID=370777 RepID=UPI0011BE4EF2|nr:response regulator [Arenimonas daejeonensis]